MAKVLHFKVTPDGQLDEDDYDRFLAKFADNISLAAISAASNVTSHINPSRLLEENPMLLEQRYLSITPTSSPLPDLDEYPRQSSVS